MPRVTESVPGTITDALGTPADRYGGAVALLWEQVVVDAQDPLTLGRWWAAALGWAVVAEGAEEVEIQEHPGQTPGIVFVPVAERKTGKNRLHLDFRPQDQTAEVERFVALGAIRVDIGQTVDLPWVVLADPEGNEFCVLSSRPPAA